MINGIVCGLISVCLVSSGEPIQFNSTHNERKYVPKFTHQHTFTHTVRCNQMSRKKRVRKKQLFD